MAEKSKEIQTTPPANLQPHQEVRQEKTNWTYRPNVDIVETTDEFMLIADVPGAARDEIDVTLQEDVLTITAPVPPRSSPRAAFYRQEYGVGGFHRRFIVEAPVDPDRIVAGCEQGVLTVRLPKAEKAKGRKIPVRSA